MSQVAPVGTNPAIAPPMHMPTTTFVTPLMLASATIGLPSKFSGRRSDWHQWKTNWFLWHDAMAKGDGSDDKLILANVAKVLDDGNAAIWTSKGIKNTSLTYKEFWDYLVSEHEKWNSGNMRQSLENLKLDNRGRMTVTKIKEFCATFKRLAAATPNFTAEEGLRLLLRQTPHYMAVKLQNENHRLIRRFHKAKVTHLPGFSRNIVAAEAFFKTITNGTIKSITAHPKPGNGMDDEFILEFDSAEQLSRLLAWHGIPMSTMPGIILKVEKLSETLSLQNCLEFLINLVEVDEDLDESRKNYSSNAQARVYQTEVNQVGNKPPKKEKMEFQPQPNEPKPMPQKPEVKESENIDGNVEGRRAGGDTGIERHPPAGATSPRPPSPKPPPRQFPSQLSMQFPPQFPHLFRPEAFHNIPNMPKWAKEDVGDIPREAPPRIPRTLGTLPHQLSSKAKEKARGREKARGKEKARGALLDGAHEGHVWAPPGQNTPHKPHEIGNFPFQDPPLV